jgi:hypothetical protein
MTYIHDNTHGIIMFIILACGASEVILAFYAEEKKLLSVFFLGVVWLGLIWASDVRMFACHCDLTESKSRIHIWIYITNMRRNWIYIAKPRCKYIAK